MASRNSTEMLMWYNGHVRRAADTRHRCHWAAMLGLSRVNGRSTIDVLSLSIAAPSQLKGNINEDVSTGTIIQE